MCARIRERASEHRVSHKWRSSLQPSLSLLHGAPATRPRRRPGLLILTTHYNDSPPSLARPWRHWIGKETDSRGETQGERNRIRESLKNEAGGRAMGGCLNIIMPAAGHQEVPQGRAQAPTAKDQVQ